MAWLEIRTSPAHSVVQSTNHWPPPSMWELYIAYIRGACGKYVAWSFFSVTDKQTHSCLVSF